MVGAVLVIAGSFRLGAISDFLSRPILVGYINGIALVLIASQLPGVLGIRSTQNDFIPQVVEIASKLGDVHWPTLWLSAFALVFLLAFRRVVPKLPGAAVVVDRRDRRCPLCSTSRRAGSRCSGTSTKACPRSDSPSCQPARSWSSSPAR